MSKAIQKHYLRILGQWPTDPLRPVSLPSFLRKQIALKFLVPRTTPAPPAPADHESSEAPANAPGAGMTEERYETEQVNALYSLLENRYQNMYKTSDDLLNPSFKPTHYSDLLKEMEEAPKRTWLQRKWLRWSGLVRFK